MRASRFKTMAMAVLAVVLSVIGVWQTGHGVWIYAKAELAQVLLLRAWASTLAGHHNVKPWPWADTWPVARLAAPSQSINLIVLAGASGRTLAFGPGYLESSALPATVGTTILTGHRDTHFKFLRQLHRGDVIALQAPTGAWTYFTVRERQILDARTALIPTDRDGTLLVLVTCYPFDAIAPGGPLRYVVTAEGREQPN